MLVLSCLTLGVSVLALAQRRAAVIRLRVGRRRRDPGIGLRH